MSATNFPLLFHRSIKLGVKSNLELIWFCFTIILFNRFLLTKPTTIDTKNQTLQLNHVHYSKFWDYQTMSHQ